jgi:hypothetical protein
MAPELRQISTESWIGATLSLFELNDGNSTLIAIEFKSLMLFLCMSGFVELLDPAYIIVSWIQLMSRVPLHHLLRQDIMELEI